jgi:hypothetical protein
MRYLSPRITTASTSRSNTCLISQYTAQDIAGVFDFTFNPVAIQDTCGIEAPNFPINFVITANDSNSITFSFSDFPYQNPSEGTGQVNNNHLVGTITDNAINYQNTGSPADDCTLDSVFTLEFDITGPGQIANATGTFVFSNISGPCALSGSSCSSVFEIAIE